MLGFEPLENRNLLSLTNLYTFNDGTASDSVGGADGTLRNGASVVDGQLYLQNTGVTSGQSTTVEYVQLPAELLTTADATIEVWYTAFDSSNWSRVFDFGNQSGSNGDSYLFFTPQSGSGDSRAVFHASGDSERVASTGTTDDGTQHMAAVVMDTSNGSSSFLLYIDGHLVSSNSLGRDGTANSINDTLNYLGRSLFNSDPGYTGLINEVRIYDHAVSSTDIATHAAEGPAELVLAGDYDDNGVVDLDDYEVWKQDYGSTENLAADGNQDGVVNLADYTIWRDNLGRVAEQPADQVLDGSSLSITRLSNTIIELTGESELIITADTDAIVNSEIRLNSPDAWLFFPNLKPSEVSAQYLRYVRVNGQAAFRGPVARVVQYELGSVVIPQGRDFDPIEAYTLPQFAGEATTLDLYTYYNTAELLGDLQGDLSSFRLKRGYMVTIATESNGSGISQVYVAQDHDLDISLLPTQLDNQAQFIRVLPWRWVSKKGSSDIAPETLNASWHYNWNNSLESTLDWEYVPIRQQRWWPGYPTNKTNVTSLLGFNEPNNPVEDAYTSLGNGSVDTAIAVWPELLATGLRVGSPAVTDGGKAWLYEFMDKAIAADLRVDYIAIHNYQCGLSATSLHNWLKDVYDRYHLPIWLTEFNNGANWTSCADPTYEQNATVIGSFIDMLDNTPWIERYSIYSRVEAVREMTYSDGSLTPAGQVYYDNESPIGYLQQYVAPGNTAERSIAQYSFDGDTLDSSGYGYNGYVHGVPNYVVDAEQGEVIDLDGTSNYIQLSDDVANGDEFSFAGWVNWQGGGNWQRIFDFGNDTSSYLFLTPSNGSSLRFAIKNGGGEQIVQTSALQVGEWTHVAVTLGNGSAKLYVDGELVATNNSVTISPSDFAPTNNYIGDSQYTSDPLFNGQLNDLLFTDYVLSPTQIAGLMTNTTPDVASTIVDLGTATRGLPYNWSIAGQATDDDLGDSVTYAKANGPAWLTIAEDGGLSGVPTTDNEGLNEFVVSVTDSRGAMSTFVMTLNVQAVPRIILASFTANDSATSDSSTADTTSATTSATASVESPAAMVDDPLAASSSSNTSRSTSHRSAELAFDELAADASSSEIAESNDWFSSSSLERAFATR
ncbi:LamG-like jellyroll fold domain-containing protein [Aeoliella mucimassa]|nr:LamG-like jellyroll fold domain-containing protein [Aeoliella mucimassa]